jgi:hypothetical protein
MNAAYGLPKPPIATTVMVQKQEMVSPKFGTPLFSEYDHDGLLLDLFGTYDGKEFDVMEVSITGTRFSVLNLVSSSLLEDMILWCERQHDKEEARAAETAEEDQREFVRGIQTK